MPILVLMLLIGLFAGVWGFLMCFFPARWDKLTEAMSFAGRVAHHGNLLIAINLHEWVAHPA